jgi:hypothetical protein
VAVVLLDELVDARADRAEDTELLDVGAEPGPESIIGAGLVDCAGVHLEPVADLPGVDNRQGDDRQSGAYRRGYEDRTPFHNCSPSFTPRHSRNRAVRIDTSGRETGSVGQYLASTDI